MSELQLDEVRKKAHQLCKEYFLGPWQKISPEEMVLKRISGGLSNLLYLCALPPTTKIEPGETEKVLMRIYGQVNGEHAKEAIVTENVIFTLMSENQRGPRLLGVFDGGRFEEYLKARPLKTKELSDSTLSCLIAEKMAQIHMMDLPISKKPYKFWSTMQRWLMDLQKFITRDNISEQSHQMLQKIKHHNLHLELWWLKEFLQKVDSPVVFCHNDLQEGNILLKTDVPEKQLVIIDYEYSSYNYRAFDFANHMCEWMFDYTNTEPPYFTANYHHFPTKEQQGAIFKRYLQTLKKEQKQYPDSCGERGDVSETNESQELEKLFREVQAFILASHFFWALWSFVSATYSSISFGYWEYGEARLNEYFKHKEFLLKKEEVIMKKNITGEAESSNDLLIENKGL